MLRCPPSSRGSCPPPGIVALVAAVVGLAMADRCTAAQDSAVAKGTPTAHQQFFTAHCLRCHDASKQEGSFRIDTLAPDFANARTAQHWANVLARINAGEMPPEDEPRPTPEELKGIATWIEAELAAGEAARLAARGPVALYRLSNEEYARTINDLLGVKIDVDQPGLFTADPRWHGFGRLGSMLSLSPYHMQKYLRAAFAVLEQAYPASPSPPLRIRVTPPVLSDYGRVRTWLADHGFADSVRAPVPPGLAVTAFGHGWWRPQRSVLPAGVYRCRIQVAGLRSKDGRVPHLTVWDPGAKRAVFDADVETAEKEPIVLEFDWLMPTASTDKQQLTLQAINEVRDLYPVVRYKDLAVAPHSWFLTTRDNQLMHPGAAKMIDDAGKAIHPLLLIDWIEWERPLDAPDDLAKRARFWPRSEEPAEVGRCLASFMEQAWRRPVTAAEVAGYERVVAAERSAGEPFRSAVLAGLAAVLSSKNFLYLEEGSADGRRDRVNDHELANRLSYFLWGSMPDAPLFATARAGRLHDRGELAAHMRRMIADPRIAEFTTSFTEQWLQLHRVGMFPPDPKLFPDYDRWLEKSMVLETQACFAEVFTHDLPLQELIIGDWTMLNRRLAVHYGLSEPKQSGFSRVSLAPGDHRGGLLTHASILSLTSDGTRHRPVHRGAWVAETVFGESPPPPPPNVTPLEPPPPGGSKRTIRALLESHATNASCAACHARIDPYGFALEQYDAIGRWRTTEKAIGGTGDDPPVDASGRLPDGRAFADAAEFKRLLAADIDRVAEAFVGSLATFALRRTMTIDDRAAIRGIVAAAKPDGYRVRSLVEALVLSDLFQKL